MGFSTSLCPHISSSFTYSSHYFKLCCIRVPGRRKTLPFVTTTTRFYPYHGINSILGARNFSISSNDAPEPARDLLEMLFVQTQRLEEHMNGNSNLVDNVQSSFDLENLEAGLHAALEALRVKEEDLLQAGKIVKLENAELNLAREELQKREEKIKAACSKQEKLEEELRMANLKVVSQTRHIEDLKMRLNQRDQEITIVKFDVFSKENEIDKMKSILTRKNVEAVKADAELESKSRLLDEVHGVVKKQELEMQLLRNDLQEKQLKLEELLVRQQFDEEKVKIAESKLEKQTMEWLVMQEEVKALGDSTSKHLEERNKTMEDFRRVKSLLIDVRSELVSSRQSLVTSRQTVEEREILLEKKLLELDEQKEAIMSYMNSLKNAHVEVECERAKLRVAEARNEELELDLSLKRDFIQGLQEELYNDKTSLEQANLELSSLLEELDKTNNEFEETKDLLEFKEKELVEARLEIQHLKSEQQSLQVVLQERDSELVSARRRLDELNTEVADLRILLNGKEEQLIFTLGMLKEKEDYTQLMQYELNHAKVKANEAAMVVERIVDLTNELAISTKDDDLAALEGNVGHGDYRWRRKQLEGELQLTRETLRVKETELLGAQRHLTIKDEGLKTILQKLEEKDVELKELKEKTLNSNDLKNLYVYADGGAGENRVQELRIEKLQLEAAQLEVEAATSALHKLVEMSRDLLSKATLCIDTDLEANVFRGDGSESNVIVDGNSKYFTEVKSEVSRLSDLTERLAQEACAAI